MKRDLEEFALYLSAEKGLSPHSQEAYNRDVKYFAAFLERRGVQSFLEVKSEDVISFLAALRQLDYASASLYRQFMSVRVLARFLKREKLITQDWTIYLDAPQVWQQIPEVLSPAEVERLLKQPEVETAVGARDRAILEILYSSGLRVSELCGLNLQDVDDAYVSVIGKGNKQRLVPIGKQAIAALDYYLGNFYPASQQDSPPLFLNKRGKRIDRILVWKMIKSYGKKAGISKEISPHTLRHSFATHLLDNGADLRVIQEMMGHAHINSTDRYMQISRKRIKEAFHSFHPRS